MAIQRLRHHVSIAYVTGLIPNPGTKILHDSQCGKKKKKKKNSRILIKLKLH